MKQTHGLWLPGARRVQRGLGRSSYEENWLLDRTRGKLPLQRRRCDLKQSPQGLGPPSNSSCELVCWDQKSPSRIMGGPRYSLRNQHLRHQRQGGVFRSLALQRGIRFICHYVLHPSSFTGLGRTLFYDVILSLHVLLSFSYLLEVLLHTGSYRDLSSHFCLFDNHLYISSGRAVNFESLLHCWDRSLLVLNCEFNNLWGFCRKAFSFTRHRENFLSFWPISRTCLVERSKKYFSFLALFPACL